MSSASLRRHWSVVGQILSFGAVDGLARAINWGTMALLPLLLRSSEEYGLVGLLVSIEILVANVSLVGQDRAILRFYAKDPAPGKLLKSALAIWAALAWLPLASVSLMWLVGFKSLFAVPVFPHLLLLSISLTFFNLHLLCVCISRARCHLLSFAYLRLTYVGLKFLLVLFMARLFGNSISYAAGVCVSGVAMLVIIIPFLRGKLEGRGDTGSIYQSLAFGWPFVFHVISGNVMDYVNRFFLQAYSTMTEVGLFTFAFTLGNGLFIVYAVLATYFEPRIYSHADDKPRCEQWLAYYTNLCVALASGAGALLVLLLPLLLSYLSPAYALTRPIIMIVIGVTLLRPLYLQGNYRLMVYKKTYHIATCTFIAAVLNIVLNVCLIPSYGMWGAAIAMYISNCFLSMYIVAVSMRVGRVRWRHQRCLSTTVLCGVGSLATLYKPGVAVPVMILVCVAACGLVISSFLTRSIDVELHEGEQPS